MIELKISKKYVENQIREVFDRDKWSDNMVFFSDEDLHEFFDELVENICGK